MRYLSALAFVVCLLVLPSASAWAQINGGTVITTIPARQQQGVFETPRWTVPMDVPAGVSLNFQFDMNTATYENEANHLVIKFFEEFLDANNVLLSRFIGGGTWDGGPKAGLDGTPNPPFDQGFPVSDYRGRVVYARFEIPVLMRVGGTLYSWP